MSDVRHVLESARVEDAALLLSHVLDCNRGWLIANDASEVSATQRERFESFCERRRLGEPVAYIVGSAGFYGREFIVNPDVLVPRPETEHLLDEVLAVLRERIGARALDVGTGSGAIACTLAAELSGLRIDAVDISERALRVARKNAVIHGVGDRIAFLAGDLLEPVRGREYECIVANLPYVPTAEICAAPDPVSFEPRLALDGGPDGLELYRRLVAVALPALVPGGLLLMEAAPPIMSGLVALTRATFTRGEITVGKDYAGSERYVKVRKAR